MYVSDDSPLLCGSPASRLHFMFAIAISKNTVLRSTKYNEAYICLSHNYFKIENVFSFYYKFFKVLTIFHVGFF